MRIVLDLEGLQRQVTTGAFSPDTLVGVQRVVHVLAAHEIFLVLNDAFPDTINPIRAGLANLLPQQNLRVWPGSRFTPKFDHFLTANDIQSVRASFLTSFRPDVLILTTASLEVAHSFKHSAQRPFVILGLPHYELGPDDIGISDHYKGLFDFVFTSHQSDVSNLFSRQGKGSTASHWSLDLMQTLKSLSERKNANIAELKPRLTGKPKLAFISPLPPERSGIADYSAELLPFLSRYYEIHVVLDQPGTSEEWIEQHCHLLTLSEFERSGDGYERIIYHFGNNPMHARMFELLERFPGVVVLHDFFLSGVNWYREAYNVAPFSLRDALYLSHGYKALRERLIEGDEQVTFRYPSNFNIFQDALGVLVHSETAVRMAAQWYGCGLDVRVVPLLRKSPEGIERKRARAELGIADDEFLVCSFGFLGKTKLSHRLLDAWEASPVLCTDGRCRLVFVGDTDVSQYTAELRDRVRRFPRRNSVMITGWTDRTTYQQYLAAADVAVQLRTLSRGETSAAVLDCMNFGLPTVVNANGSMADMPDDVVRRIPDHFSDHDLISELEYLRYHPKERKLLSERAQHFARTTHAPEHCASIYADALECFYGWSTLGLPRLIRDLAHTLPQDIGERDLRRLAQALALCFPDRSPARTLFVDVSVVARDDFKTGIQRAVRALTLALIEAPPPGFRVEPVYLCNEHGPWQYRFARGFTLNLLNLPQGGMADEIIEAQPGDILLGLDLAGGYVIQADREGVYRDLQTRGVKVSFVVYDLIPVRTDNSYPPGFKEGHAEWLNVVARADSAICISRSVADDLAEWVAENPAIPADSLDIQWFHLGADLQTSSPSTGLPENASQVLEQISGVPSFLMVGTLEPRKGHRQALDAFEQLWASGYEINLVFVGKAGWMVEDLQARLLQHMQLGQRFHWLQGISDEYLLKVYAHSTCLLAASEGEGFGLPLIEAARHGLPLIARDIPVFREVTGDNAFYFSGGRPLELADAIRSWLTLFAMGTHPTSHDMEWITWKESARQLADVLIPKGVPISEEQRLLMDAQRTHDAEPSGQESAV